jgi:flagellar capping protein FliD
MPYTKFDGVLDQREESAQNRIGDINDQIDRMEQRLEAREALLRQKFTMMEVNLARLQGMQASLSSNLAQIAAVRR